LMSLSDNPIARIIDLWGARIAPSVVSHDRHFPGARFASLPGGVVFSPGVVVVIVTPEHGGVRGSECRYC
jgi:hypothetical protein